MELCLHCNSEIHTPDDRSGLIHKSGKYGCEDEKGKWRGTVATEGKTMEMDSEEDEYFAFPL